MRDPHLLPVLGMKKACDAKRNSDIGRGARHSTCRGGMMMREERRRFIMGLRVQLEGMRVRACVHVCVTKDWVRGQQCKITVNGLSQHSVYRS